jgi:hypothetical protein
VCGGGESEIYTFYDGPTFHKLFHSTHLNHHAPSTASSFVLVAHSGSGRRCLLQKFSTFNSVTFLLLLYHFVGKLCRHEINVARNSAPPTTESFARRVQHERLSNSRRLTFTCATSILDVVEWHILARYRPLPPLKSERGRGAHLAGTFLACSITLVFNENGMTFCLPAYISRQPNALLLISNCAVFSVFLSRATGFSAPTENR